MMGSAQSNSHVYSKEASGSKIMSEDETVATWAWEIWLLYFTMVKYFHENGFYFLPLFSFCMNYTCHFEGCICLQFMQQARGQLPCGASYIKLNLVNNLIIGEDSVMSHFLKKINFRWQYGWNFWILPWNLPSIHLVQKFNSVTQFNGDAQLISYYSKIFIFNYLQPWSTKYGHKGQSWVPLKAYVLSPE